MATENAELNYSRRKADAYAAPNPRGAARPSRQPYEPPRRKETPAKPAEKADDIHPVKPFMTLTPAEIRAILLVIIVVTAVAMGIVFLAAEATVKQKEINDLKKNIAQVDDDIANLKIEIEQSQNMQLIKGRAQSELGLKDPTFDQYVYISDLPAPESDFGKYIKEKAYGGTPAPTADPEAQ